jgi:type I restriction enzyme S subunit
MTPAMPSDAKPNLTPKLRFPEFRKVKGWTEKELRLIADPVTERANNEDENNILTLSGEHGLVLQSEYFGKQIAGTNSDRYIRIQRDDFVYNDRVTKASAYGTIKRLKKQPHGIVSPIYKCFRFKGDEQPSFWEWYFEAGAHDLELHGLANEGARAGRFNVSIERFLSTSVRVPVPDEQQKIAECLGTLDELMGAESQKLDALKAHKNGLMQQLFPRAGETRPRLRFPEFQNAPEWTEKQLDDVLESITSGLSIPQNGGVDGYRVTRIETISNQTIDLTKVGFISTDQDISGYKLRIGDMLLSNINSVSQIGKTAFVSQDYDLYHGMNLLRLIVDKAENSPLFVYYLLNTDSVRESFRARANKAVNQASINQTELGRTAVTLPKKAEQQHIADCLSALDELIAAQRAKHAALQTHKQGLMQQLFPSPPEVET